MGTTRTNMEEALRERLSVFDAEGASLRSELIAREEEAAALELEASLTLSALTRGQQTLAEAALRACLAPVGDESREGSAQDVWRALAKEADGRRTALEDAEARLAAARSGVVAARSALLGHQASRLSPRR